MPRPRRDRSGRRRRKCSAPGRSRHAAGGRCIGVSDCGSGLGSDCQSDPQMNSNEPAIPRAASSRRTKRLWLEECTKSGPSAISAGMASGNSNTRDWRRFCDLIAVEPNERVEPMRRSRGQLCAGTREMACPTRAGVPPLAPDNRNCRAPSANGRFDPVGSQRESRRSQG